MLHNHVRYMIVPQSLDENSTIVKIILFYYLIFPQSLNFHSMAAT